MPKKRPDPFSSAPFSSAVATAKPDGAEYSVTPMDDAMLTRMMHFTMRFDAKAWAKWAVNAGIDSRGIDFVLNYPEAVTGQRTTPRTLTYFYEQIADLKDLEAEMELVATLAASCLDETTVAAFLSFVNDDMASLIDPLEILEARNQSQWSPRFQTLVQGKGGAKRVDRIAAMCTRLFLHVTADGYTLNKQHTKNLALFLLQDEIPNDLRASLLLDLSKDAVMLKSLLRD